jgi:hypothetical protein
MKITILYGNGEYRVHAAGCRDITKDARRLHDDPWTIEVADRQEADMAMWSDIASDREETGTPEHTKLVKEYSDMETVYLPCVKF